VTIQVDLVPTPPYADVVVLIDVLRTCTVAPILFENGLQTLHLATRIKLARAFAAERGALLLGERKGLPPEGFNFGNSPAHLRQKPMRGEAVLVSENAPAALTLLTGAEHVLLGSLYNAEAVARRALELSGGRMFLVGCGLWGQQDLDDALAAGFLAALLKCYAPEAELTGAARFAVNLLKVFPDPLEALWRSSSGYHLRRLDLWDDLAVASLISQTAHVPELTARQSHDDAHLFSFGSRG
jgi:2-phosphosulfolactate phosphatase